MNTVKSSGLLKKIDNIIHMPTQQHDKQVDLTVSKIFKLKNRGSLDFGGSEFQPSNLKKIKPEKKNPNDDYGWWKLEKGTYIVEYNEKIKEGPILIQPHNRLIKTGSYTTNRTLNKTDKIIDILTVGENGVDIKENARIAAAFNIK